MTPRRSHGYISTPTALLALVAGGMLVAAAPAYADSGLYIGGSLGRAAFEADDINFDEDDTARKLFVGYNIDAFVIDLALEGSYVDFGEPSAPFLGSKVGLDADGLNLFGLAGLELGPIGVFAKAGFIDWDADVSIDGVNQGGESGTDPAYGIGARFSLWSVEVRAEYEFFDVGDLDDLSMVSIGVAWTF